MGILLCLACGDRVESIAFRIANTLPTDTFRRQSLAPRAANDTPRLDES